jgi:hypothetical protein
VLRDLNRENRPLALAPGLFSNPLLAALLAARAAVMSLKKLSTQTEVTTVNYRLKHINSA